MMISMLHKILQVIHNGTSQQEKLANECYNPSPSKILC